MVNPLGHWIRVLFYTRSRIPLRGLSGLRGIGFWNPLSGLSGLQTPPGTGRYSTGIWLDNCG